MRVPQDVIIQIDDLGNWIIHNVFANTFLSICDATLLLLKKIQNTIQFADLEREFNDKEFVIQEIEFFSNIKGLLADPTRMLRDASSWPTAKKLKFENLLKLLEQKKFIINDEKKYSDYFKQKSSILDNSSIGNFHQQLGYYLRVQNKLDPESWWIDQKFTEDKLDIRDNLYKSIQKNFLAKLFKSKLNNKTKILDLGCGIGFYSNLMAECGAMVTGIDPNINYINIAKQNFKKTNLSFHVSEIGASLDSTKWIESNSFDYVFMSDAMLFYFVSINNDNNKPKIEILLSEIKRILKPNGKFFSMEPHGVFWLRPWLGEKNRPFTVITEYKDKMVNVAPTSYDLIKTFNSNGFNLKNIEELYPDDISESTSRGEYFASKFPLWAFYELEHEA